MKTIVTTDRAPAAVGPYSQAVWAGDFLFISGQIPLDPHTGTIIGDDAAAQAKKALENVKAVLEAAGLGMEHLVKVTVLLDDLADFAAVNEVYAEFFPSDYPARAAYQAAGIPRGALVEIDAIAWRG